jgi:hypothetical protein
MNTAITKLTPPTEIESFFMRPPLVIGESRLEYERMFTALANTIRPQNPIEWLLVNDILNHSWNIRRFGKAKAALINMNWKDAIRRIAESLLDGDQEERGRVSQDLADGWFTSGEAKETMQTLLAKHQLNEDAIAAQAMTLRLPELDIIGRKMERAMAGRMAIMRDLEYHRVAGTWKMPKDLLQIVDGAADAISIAPPTDHAVHTQ